jgi:hypothetical protein
MFAAIFDTGYPEKRNASIRYLIFLHTALLLFYCKSKKCYLQLEEFSLPLKKYSIAEGVTEGLNTQSDARRIV